MRGKVLVAAHSPALSCGPGVSIQWAIARKFRGLQKYAPRREWPTTSAVPPEKVMIRASSYQPPRLGEKTWAKTSTLEGVPVASGVPTSVTADVRNGSIATARPKQVVRPCPECIQEQTVAPREYSAFDFRGVNEAGLH